MHRALNHASSDVHLNSYLCETVAMAVLHSVKPLHKKTMRPKVKLAQGYMWKLAWNLCQAHSCKEEHVSAVGCLWGRGIQN